MSAPDKGIPRQIVENAQCDGIIPGLKKAGFIIGAKYGKGGSSGPSTMVIEGGSIPLQLGAGETDLVMVVKNKSGEEKLMQDKFTIGASAAAMAGPDPSHGASANRRPNCMRKSCHTPVRAACLDEWTRVEPRCVPIMTRIKPLWPGRHANRNS